jgi:hypothetical protein
LFAADGVGGQIWLTISSAVLLAIGSCFFGTVATIELETGDTLAVVDHHGSHLSDPFDVNFDTESMTIAKSAPTAALSAAPLDGSSAFPGDFATCAGPVSDSNPASAICDRRMLTARR